MYEEKDVLFSLITLENRSGVTIPRLVNEQGAALVKDSVHVHEYDYGPNEEASITIKNDSAAVKVTRVWSGPVEWGDAAGGAKSTTVTMDPRLESLDVVYMVTAHVRSEKAPEQGATTEDGWVYSEKAPNDDGYVWTLDPYVKFRRCTTLTHG